MPERLEENSSASAPDYSRSQAVAVPPAPPIEIEDEGKIQSVRARGLSPSRMIWRKLRRNRAAMFGLYTLLVLYASAILAGFLAPYKYDNAAHDFPFYPPMITRIHLFDEQGNFTRPFVYGIIPDDPTLATYHDDVEKKYPLRFFVRGESYHILWIIRSDIHLFGVDEPGRIFLFGSDMVGQDIFSRILYGAQVSLSIGIVGIIISTIIGMIVGAVAGYFGGATDFLLMRMVEVVLAVPSLYFILIMRQMFGTGSEFNRDLLHHSNHPGLHRMGYGSACDSRNGALFERAGVRHSSARARLHQHANHTPPHTAEHFFVCDRDGDAHSSVLHPRRSGAFIPRRRHTGAGSELG